MGAFYNPTMKHTLALSALILALVCVSYSQKPVPTPTPEAVTVSNCEDVVTTVPSERLENGVFISRNGKFSIAIPVMPTNIIDLATEKAKAKGIDAGKNFIWRYETSFVQVFYDPGVDPDGVASPMVFKDFEEGTRKGILNSNSTITSEKSISYGESKGIEFRGVYFNGFKYITRVYLIGDRGYQIIGAYTDTKDEPTILATLDSFKSPLK